CPTNRVGIRASATFDPWKRVRHCKDTSLVRPDVTTTHDISVRPGSFNQDPLFIEVHNNQVLDHTVCLPQIESLAKHTLTCQLPTVENRFRSIWIGTPGKCGLG